MIPMAIRAWPILAWIEAPIKNEDADSRGGHEKICVYHILSFRIENETVLKAYSSSSPTDSFIVTFTRRIRILSTSSTVNSNCS